MKSKVRNLWDWRKLYRKKVKQLAKERAELRYLRGKYHFELATLKNDLEETTRHLHVLAGTFKLLSLDPELRYKFVKEHLMSQYYLQNSPFIKHAQIGATFRVELEFPANWQMPENLKK